MHEPSTQLMLTANRTTGFWFCCRRLVCQQNQLELDHFPYTSQLVRHSQNIEMSRETIENWPGQNLPLPGLGQIERLLKYGS